MIVQRLPNSRSVLRSHIDFKSSFSFSEEALIFFKPWLIAMIRILSLRKKKSIPSL